MDLPEMSRSQSPSPLANEVEATAYADILDGSGYKRLGRGLVGIYQHREPSCLDACRGFALDLVEEIKGLFQREDPWANLRRGNRGRVVISVNEIRTVTVVQKT